jgi:enoyl-CoA hydratase
MPDELTYIEADGVGTVTLNRPQARNALTTRTYAELEAAVRGSTARCLVITGADPAFCSGDDVKHVMAAAGERIAAELRVEPRLTPAAQALLTTDIPVVARSTGPRSAGAWSWHSWRTSAWHRRAHGSASSS